MTTKQRAPAGLGVAGKALWRTHTADVLFRPDELKILETAARVADQICDLEDTLKGESAMVSGSQGQRVINPMIPELRQQRALLASLLNRLDVPEADAGDWDKLNASQRARRAARARWDNRR